MANLSILNGNDNSFYVMNGDTRVATLYFDRGVFTIHHNFSKLGMYENLDALGEFETAEACLPKIEKIIKEVIQKLS